MFDPSVNCECMMGEDIDDGTPQLFGFDFEPKANLTFTFRGATRDSMLSVLCSPFYFTIKELVRRTKYSAIAVFAETDSPSLINGVSVGPYIAMVYKNETSIFLSENVPISENILQFTTITPFLSVEPLISIIGSTYPFRGEDSLLSVWNIYDFYVWSCLLISILIVSFVVSFEKNNQLSPGFNIVNYLDNIWISFKGAYLGTKIRTNRVLKTIVHSMNILMVLIILKAFSSLITSTLINTRYTVIDSMDDLLARPQLTHFVHYSYESMNLIRNFGTNEEKDLLERGLKNSRPDLVTDEINLMNARNQMKKLIIEEKTHVIVSDLEHSKLIQTSIIGHKSSHISSEFRLYIIWGTVHNKNLDPFVAQKYYELLYDLMEKGLHSKWVTDIMQKASDLNKIGDLDKVEDLDHQDTFAVKLAPALGPFAIGMTLSFISFLFEFYSKFHLGHLIEFASNSN